MPNIQSTPQGLERSPAGMSPRKISQEIVYGDFTDGGSTAGTLTMTEQLPEGAFIIGTKVTVSTAFTGTVSLKAGKSSGEDEFTDGTTVDISSADVVGDSAEDPLEYLAADTSVYLYAAHSSDWGSVVAGAMTVEIFYLSTVPE